jgi:hypothetical protein
LPAVAANAAECPAEETADRELKRLPQPIPLAGTSTSPPSQTVAGPGSATDGVVRLPSVDTAWRVRHLPVIGSIWEAGLKR